MGFSFSTERVMPSDRIEAWQCAVRNSFVPMSVKIETALPVFSGAIDSRMLDHVCLSLVEASQHRVLHSKRDIDNTQGDYLLVSLQLAGVSYLKQHDQVAQVNPGELIAYDAQRPYEWVIPAAFRQLVVRAPKQHFHYAMPALLNGVPRAIACHTGMGRVTFSHVSEVFEQADALRPGDARSLVGGLVEAISRTLSEAFGKEPAACSNVQMMHLRRAHAFIDDQISNPELSPEMVAAYLGISVRHLHNLFHGEQQSVGRFILQKRLAHCARAITDPALTAVPVSSIAYSWGFNSPGHFSRAFRAEFGLSPREYRLMHLRSPTNAC